MKVRTIASASLLLLFACVVKSGGVGDPQQALIGNNAGGAAIFAASGVAGAVGHRAVTGGCYSTCPGGLRCDRATGTCVKPECVCPADLVCERVGAELVCVQPRVREHPPLPDSGLPDSGQADAAIADAPVEGG